MRWFRRRYRKTFDPLRNGRHLTAARYEMLGMLNE
jgi:hypothetical protein